jgi:hypothetical protein
MKITESQLQEIALEEFNAMIENGEIDEGVLDALGAGAKKVAGAVGGAVKKGAQAVGGAVAGAAQKGAKAVGDAGAVVMRAGQVASLASDMGKTAGNLEKQMARLAQLDPALKQAAITKAIGYVRARAEQLKSKDTGHQIGQKVGAATGTAQE